MITINTSVVGVFKGDHDDLLEQFTLHNTSNYDRAERLAKLYIKWGKILNKRADFAWCQMEHETGHLNFRGDVKPGQNNFSGIGATGGVLGNSFRTEELGVIAQYVHICWYTEERHLEVKDENGDLYCSKKYDPRHFDYFDPNGHRYRGETIKVFSEAWAVGAGAFHYSERIVKYMNEIGINKNENIEIIEKDYDVIVHMGHVGRKSGFTGTTGEQAFNQTLGDLIKDKAKRVLNLKLKLMGADNWYTPEPNKAKIFIALHADGSTNQTAKGFSVGYPPASDNAYSELFVENYSELVTFPQRPDNYTKNMSHYYAWRNDHIVADYYMLIEHGFLTNVGEREWLTSNTPEVADCHVKTILQFMVDKYKFKPHYRWGGGYLPKGIKEVI